MFADVDVLLELGNNESFIDSVRLMTVEGKSDLGRNDKLKAIVAASLDAQDSIGSCLGKIIDYDQKHHATPLFSDESDPQMRNGDVQGNAMRFFMSVLTSINQKRLGEGKLPQNFRLERLDPRVSFLKGSKIFVSATTMMEKITPQKYIIDKVIEEDTNAMIFGPSKGGKTFTAMDIGCAIATGGKTLHGRKCSKGIVLYLVGEGHGGIRKRLRAWVKHNGMTKDDLIYFQTSTATVSFNGDGLEYVAVEAKELQELHGMLIKLIIIDTLARHIDGDENTAKDAGKFIQSLDNLRQSLPGCSTLTIHHTGHGQGAQKRARGSSAFEAAMDCVIYCNEGTLSFTKLKDGELPSSIDFKLMKVEIGTGEDDEPITSCYVEYGEKAAKNRNAGLNLYGRIIVEILEKSENGLFYHELREEFFKATRVANPELKQQSIKTSLSRTLNQLKVKNMVLQEGDHYSLSSQFIKSIA